MVMYSEEGQKRLDEFHKNYDENVLDENLRKEMTRMIATVLLSSSVHSNIEISDIVPLLVLSKVEH